MNRGTVPFYGRLEPQFRLDGLGTVFTAILARSGPWRPCTPFEYMKHEGHEKFFFMFYVITYGVTLWDCAGGGYRDDVLFLRDAYAGDAAVDYAYPCQGRRFWQAVHICTTSGRRGICVYRDDFYPYLRNDFCFCSGGVLDMAAVGNKTNLLLFIYVLCFCGFSVKTAMWPFSAWFPESRSGADSQQPCSMRWRWLRQVHLPLCA